MPCHTTLRHPEPEPALSPSRRSHLASMCTQPAAALAPARVFWLRPTLVLPPLDEHRRRQACKPPRLALGAAVSAAHSGKAAWSGVFFGAQPLPVPVLPLSVRASASGFRVCVDSATKGGSGPGGLKDRDQWHWQAEILHWHAARAGRAGHRPGVHRVTASWSTLADCHCRTASAAGRHCLQVGRGPWRRRRAESPAPARRTRHRLGLGVGGQSRSLAVKLSAPQ